MSVYFVTCREAEAVKIGSSLEPYSRMAELKIGCPLPLVLEAMMPGGCKEERALHRRFAGASIHGEWFRLTAEIEQIIAANPPPPPPERIKISAAEYRVAGIKRLKWEREQAEAFRAQERANAEQQTKRFLGKLEARGDIHFPFRAKEPA